MTIRIVLADDQALLRSTFRMLIDATDGLAVIGEAANGREAIDVARDQNPDLVLMDIRMPVLDGLRATQEICADPELLRTRVLILTTFETDENVSAALRAGASGFLGKDMSAEELLGAIRTVHSGDALLSPLATKTLIARFLSAPERVSIPPDGRLMRLTDREREVTALVAQGLTNSDIADRLVLSPLTVRTHVQRAMSKLDARERAQLVVIAYQDGLVDPADSGRTGA